MSITINGSGTITGISAGGLPDGSVTAADIESSLDLSGKTVTLPSGTGGKVLQVQYTLKTDTYSSASADAWRDVTGLNVNITPSSTSSKILVFGHLNITQNATNGAYKIIRNGNTDVGVGTASGSRPAVTGGNAYTFGGNDFRTVPFNGVDTPSSTSLQNYSIRIIDDGGTFYVNRTVSDADDTYGPRSSSMIIAMEIAG
jgi:hypothetical protein